MQPQKKIKLLMLGDSGVGKSSLVDRFTEDHFNLVTVRQGVTVGGEGDTVRGGGGKMGRVVVNFRFFVMPWDNAVKTIRKDASAAR